MREPENVEGFGIPGIVGIRIICSDWCLYFGKSVTSLHYFLRRVECVMSCSLNGSAEFSGVPTLSRSPDILGNPETFGNPSRPRVPDIFGFSQTSVDNWYAYKPHQAIRRSSRLNDLSRALRQWVTHFDSISDQFRPKGHLTGSQYLVFSMQHVEFAFLWRRGWFWRACRVVRTTNSNNSITRTSCSFHSSLNSLQRHEHTKHNHEGDHEVYRDRSK